MKEITFLEIEVMAQAVVLVLITFNMANQGKMVSGILGWIHHTIETSRAVYQPGSTPKTEVTDFDTAFNRAIKDGWIPLIHWSVGRLNPKEMPDGWTDTVTYTEQGKNYVRERKVIDGIMCVRVSTVSKAVSAMIVQAGRK